MSVFVLSIEETAGNSHQHGFHLGTIESEARNIVEEKMRYRREHDLPCVTMALMRDHKIVDVLYRDGKWHSQQAPDGWAFAETDTPGGIVPAEHRSTGRDTAEARALVQRELKR